MNLSQIPAREQARGPSVFDGKIQYIPESEFGVWRLLKYSLSTGVQSCGLEEMQGKKQKEMVLSEYSTQMFATVPRVSSK